MESLCGRVCLWVLGSISTYLESGEVFICAWVCVRACVCVFSRGIGSGGEAQGLCEKQQSVFEGDSTSLLWDVRPVSI